MADKIKEAYRSSKSIYDNVLTQRSLLSRLYIRLFWGGTDDRKIAEKMLSCIPDDFCGRILDVPVGTAVFTHEKWKRLTKAEITCLDYSEDMLQRAGDNMDSCDHITCIQGDVGALPMADETYDIVLSMNGFHAFPDKEKAWAETYRVLKNGGKMIACFYIRGRSGITDWLVNAVLSRKGWFTPPFDTEQQLRNRLDMMYRSVKLYTDGSMVYFECRK